MSMTKALRRPVARLASAALLASVVGAPASADVISGTSNAYTASADLTATILGNNVNLSTGNIGIAQNVAPPPYSTPVSLGTVNVGTTPVTVGNPAVLGFQYRTLGVTGTVGDSLATSTVNGNPGSQTTAASNTLANLNLGLLSYTSYAFGSPVLSGSLLSVTANAVTTTASVSGDYGSWTTGGGVFVDNLTITLAGTTLYQYTGLITSATVFDLTLNSPITSGTATLTLAEMVPSTSANSATMETNFLHLRLDNVSVNLPVLGSLAGISSDVIVGHAFANQLAIAAAVPEPASFAMAGLAMGAGGLVHLRRRKAAKA